MLPFLLLSSTAFAADIFPLEPELLAECVDQLGSKGIRLEYVYDVNPYYLRGDFDGDGKMDYVSQVVRRGSAASEAERELGLVFCLASGRSATVGPSLGLMPPDADPALFTSLWWEAVEQDSEEVKELKAGGDVVVMVWETASGAIYWNGDSYQWHWIVRP